MEKNSLNSSLPLLVQAFKLERLKGTPLLSPSLSMAREPKLTVSK